MKAAVFEKCGEPSEVLQVKDIDAPPAPQRNQVRVRMLVSPINPSDLLYIRGTYGRAPKLPATPGFEGVGVVEESGGGLLGWRVKGKRVAVLNTGGGNWQSEVVIPARQAVPVPDDLSDEQAASFFVNPASALVMIRYVLKVKKNKWLVQSAAGGALGRIVIGLGKKYGFRTINIVRRPEQIDELKALGADEVITGSPQDLAESIHEITGGDGASYAIDAVGGETGSTMARSLGENGHMLVYGTLSEEDISLHPRVLMVGQKRIEGFWMSEWAKKQGVFTMLGLFRRVSKLLKNKAIDTHVGEVLPLDQVNEAVRKAEEKGKKGKILLRIAD